MRSLFALVFLEADHEGRFGSIPAKGVLLDLQDHAARNQHASGNHFDRTTALSEKGTGEDIMFYQCFKQNDHVNECYTKNHLALTGAYLVL